MKMKSLLKQQSTGRTWGMLLHTIGQMAIPLTLMNTTMLIVTMSSILQERGIMIPAYMVGIIIICILLVVGILMYKLSLPSFFAAWNDQFYRHDNPLRKDIEAIKKELKIK